LEAARRMDASENCSPIQSDGRKYNRGWNCCCQRLHAHARVDARAGNADHTAVNLVVCFHKLREEFSLLEYCMSVLYETAMHSSHSPCRLKVIILRLMSKFKTGSAISAFLCTGVLATKSAEARFRAVEI